MKIDFAAEHLSGAECSPGGQAMEAGALQDLDKRKKRFTHRDLIETLLKLSCVKLS